MGNTFFKFKQFIIHQDKCAMKVCTDSCLFGAWTAHQLINRPINKVLDIGTGTGVLSLMIAQKINTKIDAVDINKDACNQAKTNFQISPWKDRIKIYHNDISTFNKNDLYDLIMCNPPFYQQSLQSPDSSINEARHDVTLKSIDLVKKVKSLLKPGGYFSVLLPYYLSSTFINMAVQHDLILSESLNVRDTNKSPFIRTVLLFSINKNPVVENSIIIKDDDGNYSFAFKYLLRDYYLAF